MYTLVVIDMQERFVQDHQTRVTTNVVREVQQARSVGADVLVVEFTGCGGTRPEIVQSYDGYSQLAQIFKSQDDGSQEVCAEIFHRKFNRNHLKVVGVNTDCCVYQTVRGLTGRLPDATIEVIADACDSDWNHLKGLTNISQIENVKVTNRDQQ